MSYFEEIKEAYELVCGGETSQAAVEQALQYENWQHLPVKITRKVLNHSDYPLLAADREQPIPTCSELAQDCQIPRRSKIIGLAYSLYRFRVEVSSSQLKMIYADDLPILWRKLERERIRRVWITTNQLTLGSERDLHGLVRRLGLYHWRRPLLDTTVFCLECRNINCVKPNALDAGLAFYFHQTPEQAPGSTRNLETGEPDMDEWLCLEVDNDSIKCVAGCFTRQEVELNMSNYFEKNAQRIRG